MIRALAAAALVVGHAGPGAASSVCRVVPPGQVTGAAVGALASQVALRRVRTGRAPVGGSVTDIVAIRNETGCPVRVAKSDGKLIEARTEVIDVAPGGLHRGAMWVPWADDYDVQNELWISLNGAIYFRVWQQSGTLRFSASGDPWSRGWFKTAPPVPGLSAEGGPRQLLIGVSAAGLPYFLFEGPPK